MRNLRMFRNVVVLMVLVMVTASSCAKFPNVSTSEFGVIPELPDLNYGVVSPLVAYDYWELRFAFGDGAEYDVIAHAGDVNSLPQTIREQFENTKVGNGFDVECMPAYCFKYVVSVVDGEIEVWNTTEDLTRFLGTIGTVEEAILLAAGHGYHWEGTREAGAIRAVSDGFELVVTKLVSFCVPVQTDRFWLHIDHNGTITIKASEVWNKMDEACI